jgi:phosphatidylserine/phosphatidylglycerophosphate/cardiolipin synthase-like enzyme
MKITRAVFCVFITFTISPARAGEIEVGFTPAGDAEGLIVRTIEGAKHDLLVAAYSFTNKQIAAALVAAQRRGVSVRVVLDKSQRGEKYTSATFLAHAGVSVRIDSMHAIMHNKFMVIDGRVVETGSFNYTTAAARRNAENALVVTDNPVLARQFADEWAKHWAHAENY